MIIREATGEDAATIAAFQVEMAYETEHLHLREPTVMRGVQAVFDDPRKGRYYLAERNGEVCGGLLTVPEWSDWRNGTVLWIHSVFVVPHARQRGVYRRLYEYLQALVNNDPSLVGLRLFVDRRNTRAQAVYEKLGMDGDHYALFEWMKN